MFWDLHDDDTCIQIQLATQSDKMTLALSISFFSFFQALKYIYLYNLEASIQL